MEATLHLSRSIRHPAGSFYAAGKRACEARWAVTSSLQAQGHNLRCGDFKAGNSPAQIATARAPDGVVLNANAAIKVVGEVKTPWPQDHAEILSLGVEQFELGMAAGFAI
ncbi:hypothetical protein N7501_006602 [Penicillium viridicatum]|nr:hypothetical protein N7501_006602 [Penicillium viridicatum]